MDSIGEIVNLTAVPYGNAQINTTAKARARAAARTAIAPLRRARHR